MRLPRQALCGDHESQAILHRSAGVSMANMVRADRRRGLKESRQAASVS